jgi:hypothetical protein
MRAGKSVIVARNRSPIAAPDYQHTIANDEGNLVDGTGAVEPT